MGRESAETVYSKIEVRHNLSESGQNRYRVYVEYEARLGPKESPENRGFFWFRRRECAESCTEMEVTVHPDSSRPILQGCFRPGLFWTCRHPRRGDSLRQPAP